MAPSSKSETEQSSYEFDSPSFLLNIQKHAPWETWAAKLNSRKKPLSLRRLLPLKNSSPLVWSLSHRMQEDSIDLILQLDSLRKSRHSREPADWDNVVANWLDSKSVPQAQNAEYALECIGWTHALTVLALRVSAETWWSLFTHLFQTAKDALASYTLDTRFNAPEHVVFGQLITSELPITLAYWFPKIDACAELQHAGKASMEEAIVELLDGEGMPHANMMGHLRFLLASWTRSGYLLSQTKKRILKKDALMQFEWLVRQSMRLRRHDNSLAFESDTLPKDLSTGLLSTALEIGGDDLDHQAFHYKKDKAHANASALLPCPAEHSEWSELAILRSDWSQKSSTLILCYANSNVQCELNANGNTVFSGLDNPHIIFNGHAVAQKTAWEEICWESDDDVDYVEIQAEFANGIRIQRQALLARDDKFLFTADAILGTSEGRIEYHRQLPISSRIQLVPQKDTREESIQGKAHIGTALPLGLPEWREASHLGNFSDGKLVQRITGKRMYCPLFIDLNPKRKKRQLTFRQLTVAQSLEIVTADVAVAFRVQIGNEQWVIYRSLDKPANRTFIGQNHISEFAIARFAEGELDNLIEID